MVSINDEFVSEGGSGGSPVTRNEENRGQFGLPASWSEECEHKYVKVEVHARQAAVGANLSNFSYNGKVWVEIPTTEVELWVNKHGQADKNRIAKVKFPTQWDTKPNGEPQGVVDLMEPFRPAEGEDNITYVRISFRESADDDWEIKHMGFIGGVGQSSRRGVSKMWVYDFSRMVDKIPVSINFNRPTPEAVMETTMRLLNDSTPARLNTEAQFIGPQGSVDDADLTDNILQTQNLVAVTTTGTVVTVPVRPDPKTFYSNRDTIGDVLDWLCTKLNAIWYFEPTRDGVSLVVDAAGTDGSYTRHTFSQPEGDLHVIENNALYEIDAINTVVLRGSQDDSVTTKVTDFFTRNNVRKRFPIATVRAESLFEANVVGSGSVESGELVYLADGDATDLDSAVREAKDLLRELVEEEAEGVIDMYGKPAVEPYDRVESHFTCAEDFPEDAIVPLLYEAEEVKHHAKAGKAYRTEVYVSIFVGEDDIKVVQDQTRMIDPDEQVIDA